jgi:hypothetical protein
MLCKGTSRSKRHWGVIRATWERRPLPRLCCVGGTTILASHAARIAHLFGKLQRMNAQPRPRYRGENVIAMDRQAMEWEAVVNAVTNMTTISLLRLTVPGVGTTEEGRVCFAASIQTDGQPNSVQTLFNKSDLHVSLQQWSCHSCDYSRQVLC